ncbi:MAG: DUF1638 domain-containing protein [Thermogutta sp.]
MLEIGLAARPSRENGVVRIQVIACEIFYREVCAVVARSINIVDVTFLPKGLHDVGPQVMSARLREAIAAVDESRYEAVALAYALCNNGLVGLAARSIPLVLPRAHDCITLFLGDKQRYLDYFYANPGVYFQTPGWMERGEDLSQHGPDSIVRKMGLLESYEDWVRKYGEENARYLREQLGNLARNYGKLTYIRTGTSQDDRFEEIARERAAGRGWRFESLEGDLRLLQNLVDGNWNPEDFLVVPPGSQIAASFDADIVRAIPPRSDTTD